MRAHVPPAISNDHRLTPRESRADGRGQQRAAAGVAELPRQHCQGYAQEHGHDKYKGHAWHAVATARTVVNASAHAHKAMLAQSPCPTKP